MKNIMMILLVAMTMVFGGGSYAFSAENENDYTITEDGDIVVENTYKCEIFGDDVIAISPVEGVRFAVIQGNGPERPIKGLVVEKSSNQVIIITADESPWISVNTDDPDTKLVVYRPNKINGWRDTREVVPFMEK